MKIDHIALYVRDLDSVRAFFVDYFGAASNEKYVNPVSGFQSYFLKLDSGTRIELMTKPILSDLPKTPGRTGYNHICISVGARELMEDLRGRLQADGYGILPSMKVKADDSCGGFVVAVEDLLIELKN
jgi:lactoylglutathione lyase